MYLIRSNYCIYQSKDIMLQEIIFNFYNYLNIYLHQTIQVSSITLILIIINFILEFIKYQWGNNSQVSTYWLQWNENKGK